MSSSDLCIDLASEIVPEYSVNVFIVSISHDNFDYVIDEMTKAISNIGLDSAVLFVENKSETRRFNINVDTK